MTPICENPFAQPPPNASAITGSRALTEVVGVGVLLNLSQPNRAKEINPILAN